MAAWEDLKRDCLNCRGCALWETRTNVVFGDGAQDAEILLIGEGPGQREDEQGIPFVGPAGQLLDDMLAMIGLDRTKVYITNTVKCRPPQTNRPQKEAVSAGGRASTAVTASPYTGHMGSSKKPFRVCWRAWVAAANPFSSRYPRKLYVQNSHSTSATVIPPFPTVSPDGAGISRLYRRKNCGTMAKTPREGSQWLPGRT